tara:strand:- start:305 stop:574 length:270 start_codon:yes stop_codon:yes gene_type:complete
MKRLLLTALLIVTANTVVAATKLSPQHDKKLPTPYELITKGEMLHKYTVDDGDPVYYIVWDKTDDLYSCRLRFNIVKCVLMVQGTERTQ